MSEHDETRDARRAAPRAQDETRSPAERPDREAAAGGRGGSGSGERRGRRRHGSGRPPQQQQGQSPRRSEPSLNMDELRELAELFTSHGLTDFEFENEDIRVRLSRSLGQPSPPPVAAPAGPSHSAGPASAHAGAAAHAAQASDASTGPAATPAAEKAEELQIITAPIVGTFYRAASPNAEPFVKAGSHVESATVVCIIEAMKLMNEIQAEITGTVEKIYVENGQPVEFGQPLFGIKK